MADVNTPLDMSTIDVAVLCGGLGKRLRSVVSDCPKPMAPVHGRPFLEYVIDNLASCGFRRFTLCVGYKANMIIEHFKDYRGLSISFSEEKDLLGTAGAVKLCGPYLKSEDVVVVNGDSLCSVDMNAFVKSHQSFRGEASIVLTRADERVDAGFVRIDAAGKIQAFAEKRRDSGAAYVNAGIYIFKRTVLERIPDGRKYSLEHDVFPGLKDDGLHGFVADCELFDIGTPERLCHFVEKMSHNKT